MLGIYRSGGVNGQHDTLLKCSLCRASAYLSQISYVQSGTFERSTHLLDVPNVQLKRSISVKVSTFDSQFSFIQRHPVGMGRTTLISSECGKNNQKIWKDFKVRGVPLKNF